MKQRSAGIQVQVHRPGHRRERVIEQESSCVSFLLMRWGMDVLLCGVGVVLVP